MHEIVVSDFTLPRLEKCIHNPNHPCIYKIINLTIPQYCRSNINKDIENYVKHCHTYQINKKCKQKRFGALQQMSPTEKPFVNV